jgi:hypothetical protein
VARHVFHIRFFALYFAALWAWQATISFEEEGFLGVLRTTAVSITLSAAGLGILAVMAWLVARTTSYTITSRRVIMQIGVALPMAVNVPFAQVEAAGLASHPGGLGDLPLRPKGKAAFGYMQLWPHARPWRVARPEPMLRCVPEAAVVAGLLAEALSAAHPAPPPRIVVAPMDAADGAGLGAGPRMARASGG